MGEFTYFKQVDPRALIVTEKLQRRRKAKNRDREPLPEQLKPWLEAAIKRKEGRSVPPGAMFSVTGIGDDARLHLTSPYDNDDEWSLMVADAFGTRSLSVMQMFLSHLGQLAPSAWDAEHQLWKPDEQNLNAALAIVHASRPKDEMDAMFCAQAVALHWLQMQAARSVLHNSEHYVNDRTAATCAKLSRAFTITVEAMDRRKRKPRRVKQEIKVTRETHYHVHKHVHLEGGSGEIGEQPDRAREAIIDCTGGGSAEVRPALRGSNESGSVVPFPGSEQQERVSAPSREGRSSER